ncbi:MAG: vWA domain-containing protein [Pseudomonadota bacterium]
MTTSDSPQMIHENFYARAAAALLVVLLLLAACVASQDADEEPFLDLLIKARDSMAIPEESIDEAASRLKSTARIRSFMSGAMAEGIYQGRLLEPQDALNLRIANEDDGAVLLHALLQAAGHEAELLRVQAPPPAPLTWAKTDTPTPAYRKLANFLDVDLDDTAAHQARVRDAVTYIRENVASADTFFGEAWNRARGWGINGLPAPASYPVVRLGDVLIRADGLGINIRDANVVAWSPPAAEPVTVKLFAHARDVPRQEVLSWTGSAATRLELGFRPTTGAEAYFEDPLAYGARPPANWMPVLLAGGEPQVGRMFDIYGASVNIKDVGEGTALGGSEPLPLPPANILENRSVRVTDNGRVSVALEHDAPNDSVWASNHFTIEDGDEPVVARIDAQEPGGRPLALLIDQSGSMFDANRMQLATDLAVRVIENLPDDREVILMGVGTWPYLFREAAPATKKQEIIDIIRTSMARNLGGNATGWAIADTQKAAGERAIDMILINDGDPRDTHQVAGVLARHGSTLHTLGVQVNAEPYAAISTTSRTVNGVEDLAGIASLLGDQLGGGLRISFEPPESASPGEEREFTIELNGSTLSTSGRYVVLPRPPQLERISASVFRGTRLLGDGDVVRFPEGGPSHEPLLSRHRIVVAHGPNTERHLVRRELDAWIERASAIEAVRGEAEFMPDTDKGPDAYALGLGSQLIQSMQAGDPEAEYAFVDPMIIVHSLMPDFETDGSVSEQLNVLRDGGLTTKGRGLAEQLWRAQAALSAAEARHLGDPSVIDALVEAGDVNYVRDILGFEHSAKGVNFETQYDGIGYWTVRYRLADGGAKGAIAEHTAQQYQRILANTTLGGTIVSGVGTLGGIPGAPLGGIYGLMVENVKQYCHAAVHLGFVNEVIAGEETGTDDWGAYARRECQITDENDMQKRMIEEFLKGFIAGWAADTATEAIGDRLMRALGYNRLNNWGMAGVNMSVAPTLSKVTEAIAKYLKGRADNVASTSLSSG